MFDIVATAKPGHTPAELLAVIDEELEKLRKNGIEPAELARAKTTIVADMTFDLEKSSQRANRLNSYAHYVGDPAYLEKDVLRNTTPTPAGVTQAATTWLKPNDRVVTLVSTVKEAPIAGRLVKKTTKGSPLGTTRGGGQ